jgi:hypothetical protein
MSAHGTDRRLQAHAGSWDTCDQGTRSPDAFTRLGGVAGS